MKPDYFERERFVDYILPDGRVVKVDDSAAKGECLIDFELSSGNMVKATRCVRDIGDLSDVQDMTLISDCQNIDNACESFRKDPATAEIDEERYKASLKTIQYAFGEVISVEEFASSLKK